MPDTPTTRNGKDFDRTAEIRRHREQQRHDSHQRAARRAADELLTWGPHANSAVPTITPADVVAKTAAMYSNSWALRNLTIDEAAEALVAVLKRRGLLTADEQTHATSADAMVLSTLTEQR